MISIIIPLFNETNNASLWDNLSVLSKLSWVQLLLIDGGSTDSTLAMLKDGGHEWISHSINCGRGDLLDFGLKRSDSEMIVLYHPRSTVEVAGLYYLNRHQDELKWGGFTHSFDRNGFIFSFTSWYSNRIRADLRGIFYLDHCIYARKNLLFKAGGIPNVEIFEDSILSYRLKDIAKPTRLRYRSETSSIRFLKNGLIFQSLLNAFMKVCFLLGVPTQKMYAIYERGLRLNSYNPFRSKSSSPHQEHKTERKNGG